MPFYSQLNPLFLSKTFWPINYDFEPTFEVPPQLDSFFELYEKQYQKAKHQRTLEWHHEIGSVKLSLSFDSGEYEFQCLPVHAFLIQQFDESSTAFCSPS